eukprot:GFKZ01005015.1.p1 GENE.GFKZ01005015.1~~GFKZ01005015.1.p1  ORF type:complete len:348 (-),score=52.60 GFKZ01005015.1:1174-2217(-)
MSSKKGSWKKKSRQQQPAPAKEADTSASIGETSLKHKNVEIYLVKMPTVLAKHFEPGAQIRQNEIVGRLRIPQDEPRQGRGSLPNPPRIFLDKVMTNLKSETNNDPRRGNEKLVDGLGKDVIPREYEINFPANGIETNFMVFSCNREGEDPDMRMEGKVSYHCTARPKLDRTYRDMNKRRTKMSLQKEREVQRLDDVDRLAADREAIQPMSLTETSKQRAERKQKKDDARRHLDMPDEKWRENARRAVFMAFEIKSHYSAEELAAVVNEPLSRLRSVITEVCSYNKSGPFAQRHELKDEFKTVAQRRQKERDVENYKQEQIEMARKRREERAERDREAPPAKKARQF